MSDEGKTTLFGVELNTDGASTTPKTPEDYLSESIGEGKQWASSEEALHALAKKAIHADQFIETLKKEKHDVQSKLDELSIQSKTAEDILNALKTADSKTTSSSVEDKTTQSSTVASLTEDAVRDLILKEREKQSAADKRAQLDAIARKALLDAFKSGEAVAAITNAYVGGDENKKALVVQLGHTDPNALVELLKSVAKTKQVSFDFGGSSESGDDKKTGHALTWAEAKKIKREDPGRYNSYAFQRLLTMASNADPDFYKK